MQQRTDIWKPLQVVWCTSGLVRYSVSVLKIGNTISIDLTSLTGHQRTSLSIHTELTITARTVCMLVAAPAVVDHASAKRPITKRLPEAILHNSVVQIALCDHHQ